MAKFNFLGMVAVIIFLSAFTINNSVSWNISEGYSIKFTNKEASGVFSDLQGDIQFDETNLEASKFDMKIDVSSINTGNGMKNKHAKGSKWFDSKQFPTINFTSKSFAKAASGYTVTGTLAMHGTEKEITIPFTFENNVFEGSFNVDRVEYGIGSTKGMSKKVPLDIQLDISVPVSK